MISRFDKSNVTCTSERGKQALESFIQTVKRSASIHKILLKPGDYLIFRNQKLLHARDSFQPKSNGADRWMIRLFGLTNLNKCIPIHKNIPYILKT